MRALDYLDTTESEACFASNVFTRTEAREFFEKLESYGSEVTIRDEDILWDHDGPGEHYVDACYARAPGIPISEDGVIGDGVNATNFFRYILDTKSGKRPDEFIGQDDGTFRLWWD